MSARRWLGVAAPISLLALWQLAVSTRVLNPGLFPPPSAIFENFVAYARSGELTVNASWTLSRLAVGLLIGGVPGTLLGLAMGMNGWVRVGLLIRRSLSTRRSPCLRALHARHA